MSATRTSILFVGLLLASSARAQEPETVAKAAPPRLEVDGRVFVRETVSQDGDGGWGGQTSISSARIGLAFHRKAVRARLSVELRSSAKLRSAYVDLAPIAELSVRAGLFKIPLSPLELTSSWVLPLADRGLTSSLLRDRLQVAGRRVGAAVAWAPGAAGSWPFRARAGYFQGVNDLGELLDGPAADGLGKVGAARLELGPFGATGQVRQGRPELLGAVRTAWAASADATLTAAGLRLWLEGTIGSSWLVAAPMGDQTLFLEARGLAAWRLGGAKGGAAYLEPYAMVGAVDPDSSTATDLALEATAGINVGQWKRWRLQVELEVWRFGKNVPMGFVAPATVALDRTAVVTQLGAAF